MDERSTQPPPTDREDASPAIEATDIRFTYPDGTEAVRDVSMTISRGEFFGFLGPNGAGKTTTIKMLVTLLRPTAGQITVNGFDVTEDPVAIRSSIGYNAQDTGVYPELTARENIRFACEAYHVPKATRPERIEALLELADLADVADKRAKTFSGGMQRRLDIATSLVHDPPLVFLDEPTTGLDPEARLRLWEYFREINAQGTTIFLTTQNLDEADQLCSRLAVIATGEIVARGSPEELKSRIGGDSLEITIEDTDAAAREDARTAVQESDLLTDADDTVGLTDDGIVVTSARARGIGTDLLITLREAGFVVTGFTVHSPTLDDVFLSVTGSTLREAHEEPAPGEEASPEQGVFQ